MATCKNKYKLMKPKKNKKQVDRTMATFENRLLQGNMKNKFLLIQKPEHY